LLFFRYLKKKTSLQKYWLTCFQDREIKARLGKEKNPRNLFFPTLKKPDRKSKLKAGQVIGEKKKNNFGRTNVAEEVVESGQV